MPPWAPVRADVAATSALLFMSRTVTLCDGTVGSVYCCSGRPNCATGAGRTLLVTESGFKVRERKTSSLIWVPPKTSDKQRRQRRFFRGADLHTCYQKQGTIEGGVGGNAQMQLPEELWQRVLYSLPARTLLRARAVCRQVKPCVPEIPVNYLDASTEVFCGLPPNNVSARVVDAQRFALGVCYTCRQWHKLVDDRLQRAPLALHWRSVGTVRCLGEGLGMTNCCAFAPDGRFLVTGLGDGKALVWGNGYWSCLRTLTGHDDGVMCCAFSPDAATLVTGSRDRTARVWSTSDWSCLRTLTGHDDDVMCCAFSPDRGTLVTGSTDSTVRVWSTSDWSCLRTLTGHDDGLTCCAFSPDGGTLFTGSSDGTARVWSTSDWSCLRTLTEHDVDGIWCCAFSPDGGTLVTGSLGRTVLVWSTGDWSCLRTPTEHNDCVWCCAFSPDGGTLVTGSEDGTGRVLSTSDWSCLRTLTGHTRSVRTNSVWSCAFAPNGGCLVTTSYSLTAHLWADDIDHHSGGTNDDVDTSGVEDSDMSDSGGVTTGSESDDDDELLKTRLEIDGLRAENAELRAENAELRAENEELRRRNSALEHEQTAGTSTPGAEGCLGRSTWTQQGIHDARIRMRPCLFQR
eukprot:1186376-Prorocentrum_minimum.AAC.2